MKMRRQEPRGRKTYWPKDEPFISLGIRIPKSLHNRVAARAKSNLRSLNAELIWLLAKEFKVNLEQEGDS